LKYSKKKKLIKQIGGNITLRLDDKRGYVATVAAPNDGVSLSYNIGTVLHTVHGIGISEKHSIKNLWTQITGLPNGSSLIFDAYGVNRRVFVWNGKRFVTEKENAK
jgi:hypothetical protein